MTEGLPVRPAASRLLGLGLMAGGATILAASVAVDLRGGGGINLGIFQVLLGAAGLTATALGWHVRTATGAEDIRGWLARPLAEWARDTVAHAGIGVQLLLLYLVFRLFELESPAFVNTIVVLAFCGFLLHAVLPRRFQLPFFVMLSFAGIYLVLGLADGAWIIGLGTVLIVLAHLPIAFWARVALILAAGGGLAALRSGIGSVPFSNAVWPILGSLFMFRMIIYLYDLRHSKQRPEPARTLSYFFMLPNVVFPFFPVVDWATFRRTYFDVERIRIYQRGVDWMFRGLTHLIAYRFVYHYLTLAPEDVTNVADLGRFMAANFLLYVRVSGQFHVIVGMLHLFGFHLPETNHKYLLSSSFADYWRRINIYWKDFMMKVVFYPVYFAARRTGERTALVLATVLVFFVTWFLHAYQWFWLLGTFPVSWTDSLFWGTLALLLVANTLYEAKHGRVREVPGQTGWSLGRLAPRALRTLGTFAVICILWSFWTSTSVGDWFGLINVAGLAPAETSAPVSFLVVLGLAVGGGFKAAGEGGRGWTRLRQVPGSTWTLAGLLLLLVAGQPAVTARLGEREREVARRLTTAELNAQDATLLQRGYYEQLMGVSRLNSQLWEIYMKRPPEAEVIWQTQAGRRRDDFMGVELVASQRIVSGGAIIATNQWAMRDRAYALGKPAGTFRISLTGASTTMGWSVQNDDTFEQLVEDRLNEQAPDVLEGRSVEILNFAVPGYTPPQFAGQIDRMLEFQPDVVLVTTQDNDVRRTVTRLVDYQLAGTPVPFDSVQRLVSAVTAGAGSKVESERLLRPHARDVLGVMYRIIAERSRAAGAHPVWMYLPGLDRAPDPADKETLMSAAREAGFTVLDLSGVYEGVPREDLTVAEYDFHPNAQGHRLVAQRLYEELLARPALFRAAGPASERSP